MAVLLKIKKRTEDPGLELDGGRVHIVRETHAGVFLPLCGPIDRQATIFGIPFNIHFTHDSINDPSTWIGCRSDGGYPPPEHSKATDEFTCPWCFS